MTSAAIEEAFRRNSQRGKMSLEGYLQALKELKLVGGAFKPGDQITGLLVEKMYYCDSRGSMVYIVRSPSGSTFEIGEIELLTLKNNKI